MRRFTLFLGLSLALAGCGTAMSCGHEFGEPRDRAFWCSDVQDIGKVFKRRVPQEPPPPAVTCVETLADRDCYPNAMAGG